MSQMPETRAKPPVFLPTPRGRESRSMQVSGSPDVPGFFTRVRHLQFAVRRPGRLPRRGAPMKSFIRFTRSAIVLSVITIGNTAGGAAGAERSPTSAQDQRDYARYQLQLAEQTARLDREDAQLGSGAPATTGAASAPAPAAGSCGLFQPGATTASAESCRACHG